MTEKLTIGRMQSVAAGAAIGLAVVFGGAAGAVPISPGDTDVALSGTTSAANPDLAGVVQRDLLHDFEIRDNLNNVILTGTLQDRASRSDNTGTLIFGPRLRDLDNPPNTTAWITGLRIEGYNGFSTDIDFRIDSAPGGIGADDVTRGVNGNELFFGYGVSIIVPPDEGKSLSIFTDATAFAPVGRATIFAQNDFGGSVFETVIEGVQVPVGGDADGDGDVDAFDLGIWQTQFGLQGQGLSADFDRDGDVDAFDLGIWQTSFGVGTELPAVPEPATASLMLILPTLLRRGGAWRA